MIDLGIRVNLLIGPGMPAPATPEMLECLQEIEVTHTDDDEKRSGFKLVFREGRSGVLDVLDYPLLKDPRLGVLSRVIITVLSGPVPIVIMDGVIIEQQLAPGEGTSGGTLTLMGEDVSIMMDFEEKVAEHPALPKFGTAAKIIATYSSEFGIVPNVLPSPDDSIPLPTDHVPMQTATDLEYLRSLAKLVGYSFYIIPGPVPFMNLAYWGPKMTMGVPQKSLDANMGANSNVRSISFSYDATAAKDVEGKVQDRDTNSQMPVQGRPLVPSGQSAMPADLVQAKKRRRLLRGTQGMSVMDAMAKAANDKALGADPVSAEGELDALRYGRPLMARMPVGVRGVGATYDGFYYVKSVTHKIKRGEYSQKFSLRRDGTMTTTPVLPNL
jgi:hypothetical protein